MVARVFQSSRGDAPYTKERVKKTSREVKNMDYDLEQTDTEVRRGSVYGSKATLGSFLKREV
jgi:hypothetical protein